MLKHRTVELAKKTLKGTGLYGLARPLCDRLVDVALAPIYERKGRRIEQMLLFIGYSRSGSTFLSELLNSHPEVVISHEGTFPLARDLLEASTWRKGRIMRRILKHDRYVRESISFGETNPYTLAVNSPWQRRRSALRVVGYKDSAKTTRCLHTWPHALDSLRRSMRVPIKALFTYRNPYDMIAAAYLRRLRIGGGGGIPADLSHFNPTAAQMPTMDLERAHLSPSNTHFDMSRKLASVLALFPEDAVLSVKHEDFIASPRETLRRVFSFLGLQPNQECLQACVASVYPSPHQTRFKVRWTAGQRARLEELIQRHPWFAGYAFEN